MGEEDRPNTIELDDENLQMFLRGIIAQIGLLDTKQLQDHVAEVKRKLQWADDFGGIFDPTGWMMARRSGEFKMGDELVEILTHIVAIRHAMNRHEDLRQKLAEKVTPPDSRIP